MPFLNPRQSALSNCDRGCCGGAWVSSSTYAPNWYKSYHHLILKSLRLNKDQKESTKKELEASADAIKLKHGLEKALKAFTKDPENAVPDEFWYMKR